MKKLARYSAGELALSEQETKALPLRRTYKADILLVVAHPDDEG